MDPSQECIRSEIGQTRKPDGTNNSETKINNTNHPVLLNLSHVSTSLSLSIGLRMIGDRVYSLRKEL